MAEHKVLGHVLQFSTGIDPSRGIVTLDIQIVMTRKTLEDVSIPVFRLLHELFETNPPLEVTIRDESLVLTKPMKETRSEG